MRKRWLIVGGVGLFAILAAAGIVTLFSGPGQAKSAEPAYWHVMGDKAHMSFRIKLAGEESYRLDVWLPTGMGAPRSVDVQASREESPDAVNVLPFEFVSGGPDPYGYEGFDKFTYVSKGQNSLDEGTWHFSIAFTDNADLDHVYKKQVVIS